MNERVMTSSLSSAELAATLKGYGNVFRDYVDAGAKLQIPKAEAEKLFAWCDPFLQARVEVSGGFVWQRDGDLFRIERVYRDGGNSQFRQIMTQPDGDFMLEQMQKDYPEMEALMSDRVGFWHLHPGYYGGPSLSLGDVEEVRTGFREAGYTDVAQMLLLVYGEPHDLACPRYQLMGFSVWPEKVYRFPVEVTE